MASAAAPHAVPPGLSDAHSRPAAQPGTSMSPGHPLPPLVLRSRHPSHPAPVTDAELDRLWTTLREEGLAPVVFHDGGVRNAADLRGLLSPRRAWCYLVQAAGAPLALCWLDGFCGRAARIHFCVLRAGLPRADEIGRTVVRFLLTAPARPDAGEPSPSPGRPAPYLLDTLVGLTPAPYRHALAFVTRLGFRRAAVVPGGAVLARPTGARVCDAVLTLCTRPDLADLPVPPVLPGLPDMADLPRLPDLAAFVPPRETGGPAPAGMDC